MARKVNKYTWYTWYTGDILHLGDVVFIFLAAQQQQQQQQQQQMQANNQFQLRHLLQVVLWSFLGNHQYDRLLASYYLSVCPSTCL